MTWRTGRRVGRTIYRQVGAEPSDDDVLIGVMDTPGLAEAAVWAVNAATGSPSGRPPRTHCGSWRRPWQEELDRGLWSTRVVCTEPYDHTGPHRSQARNWDDWEPNG